MKSKFYILLSFIVIIYGFQCIEECDEFIFDRASLSYEIDIPQNTYQVGDTITIDYTDGNMISLVESMTDLELSDQHIIQFFDLFEVKADNMPIVSGTENFQVSHSGNRLDYVINTNELSRLIIWTCNSENCGLNLQLIAQKSGYYGFRLLHGNVTLVDQCESYDFYDNTFNIQDNNFEILNEINTDELNIEVPIQFDVQANSEGQFFFKVQ